MVSFAVIGGVLLNIGAFLTFKGKIYESSCGISSGRYMLGDHGL